jgi:hypothetical protein
MNIMVIVDGMDGLLVDHCSIPQQSPHGSRRCSLIYENDNFPTVKLIGLNNLIN